jgi:hypothetical protein
MPILTSNKIQNNEVFSAFNTFYFWISFAKSIFTEHSKPEQGKVVETN